jgi:hypothetical protein
MLSDPRDSGAYRIAIACIGFALVVVLAGVCVILAVNGTSSAVPQQLWTTISALGGGLLGILAPSPGPSAATKKTTPQPKRCWFARGWFKLGRGLVILGKDIWSNRAIVIVLVVFVFALVYGISDKSEQLRALAGASGGVLVGMLAPSPGKKEPPATGGGATSGT